MPADNGSRDARMTTHSTPLADLVGVGHRFRRAVNLERDAGAQDALHGYMLTPTAHRALSQIADGLERSEGERAWSLVGPYGSGKSAFAVFLADVLSPTGSPGRTAAKKLLTEVGRMTLPDQTLYPTLLTAERAPLDTMLLRALHATLDGIWKGKIGRKPKVLHTVRNYLNGSAPSVAQCATSAVVHCFEDAARAVADLTGNGLLLVVDEAGKALEYAALEPSRGDVYLLQALAEAAARSDGAPFVLLTVLHQSFDHYAHQLGHSERNEWAKVQGRFGDLAFREGSDQLIRLTAEAITHTGAAPATADWKRLVSTTARWVSAGTGWSAERLERSLDACWPLHPVTAALLGPLFRGRLAQNERSLFAFLSSGEPFGFRDFLRTHGADDLYTVDRLYDYALGILGDRLFSRAGRDWADIDSALRRCAATETAIEERIVKTVGLLGMLGDQVGLRASTDVVSACVGDRESASDALDRLNIRSIFVYRQFRDAYRIWEGSDLDLDDLIAAAAQQMPADASVAATLQRLTPRDPLVAHRHLYRTGTFRYFDVRFVDAAQLFRQEDPPLDGEGDGAVLLALPRTEGEAQDLRAQPAALSLAVARHANGKPVVLVTPPAATRLAQLARELAAAEVVQTSTPALQSDPTARTELSGRIDDLGRQVAAELERAFDPSRSAWHSGGDHLRLRSWREAMRALSDLCDVSYDAAPPMRNELLNRRTLSTSAARARRNLLEAMILRRDEPHLGFDGYPPEVSMYRSVLDAHGFHRRRRGAWRFDRPKPEFDPLWREIDRYLADTEAGRRPLIELYDRLRQPPFGLKDGPLPVVVLAALLALEDEVAIYEHGTFVPAWTPSHAERLLRRPQAFAVRRCRLGNLRRDVFDRLARLLASPSDSAPSLLDLVRRLVRFVAALPPYARLTRTISSTARNVRDALVRAREPAALLFADLPAACGGEPFSGDDATDRGRVDAFVEALRHALREVQDAYPGLLARCRTVMARQLELPDPPGDFTAELRERSRRVLEVAVDPTLKSFVVRGADGSLEPDDLLVSLLTQLANKPPAEWADTDEDRFQVRLAEVARRFRNMETLLVDNGADLADGAVPLLRLAVARRGHAERERVLRLRAGDEQQIANVRRRLQNALGDDPPDRVLAALALITEDILASSDDSGLERRQP